MNGLSLPIVFCTLEIIERHVKFTGVKFTPERTGTNEEHRNRRDSVGKF